MKEGLSKQTIWGLVLLFGFTATHFLVLAGYPIYLFFLFWVFILALSFFTIYKEVLKKMPLDVETVWRTMTVLQVLLTILFLTNLIQVDYSLIMAMWLGLMGASTIATGLKMNWPESTFTGLMWFFFSLVIPTFFTNTYFLLAGFVFGIPLIFVGHLSK